MNEVERPRRKINGLENDIDRKKALTRNAAHVPNIAYAVTK